MLTTNLKVENSSFSTLRNSEPSSHEEAAGRGLAIDGERQAPARCVVPAARRRLGCCFGRRLGDLLRRGLGAPEQRLDRVLHALRLQQAALVDTPERPDARVHRRDHDVGLSRDRPEPLAQPPREQRLERRVLLERQLRLREVQVELADWTYNPEETLYKQRQRVSIAEAIESLPPKYKQVIVMRHRDDMAYFEIARQLGVPVGTVKARIFRAREAIDKSLKPLLTP